MSRIKPAGRLEVRSTLSTWPRARVEIRAKGDGREFSGYAAVFNSPSERMPGVSGPFVETIEPGAFAKSLASGRDIRMFVNHNSDLVLAGTRSRTLQLREDTFGLLSATRLPDTTQGRDMGVLLKAGIVDSMSFSFVATRDEWSTNRDRRRILEAELFEVSPITSWPAYPATSASVRADFKASAMTALREGRRLTALQTEYLQREMPRLLASYQRHANRQRSLAGTR